MVMTRAQWEAMQSRLPEEDRMSYEDYLQSEGVFAPPASSVAAEEGGTKAATSIGSQFSPEITENIQNIPTPTTVVNEPADNEPANENPPSGGGQLPPGFTAGKYPSEFDKFFGPADDDVIGYKLTPYTDKSGKTFYRLSVSRKGAYGDAQWGSSEFGAAIIRGAGGEWESFSPATGGGSGSTGGGSTGGVTPPGQTYTAPDGRIFTDLNAYNTYVAKLNQEAKQAQSQSAFDFLLNQFTQYGLQALVEPLRDLIKQGVPASEFTIRLRETDAYKKRFAANAQRINKGLRVLSEAEYIKLEDDYQDVMRRYGLPASYYERGELGRQEGFEKFIAGDVSAPELERRVQMAQERVMDADPMIGQTLREFYPSITNGEILAFALDPDRALPEINRKITAAEIGSAQYGAKLAASRIRAEELAAAGVTGKQYQQAAPTIADIATRGSTLAQIYEQRPFGQIEAEQETLGISGAAEARERRKRLTQLEQASFAGQAGAAGGALGRERAGAF